MRTALIIALIALASCAIDIEEQQDFLKFQEFCAKYGKNYESYKNTSLVSRSSDKTLEEWKTEQMLTLCSLKV
jgi:hypothetical protein